MRLCSSALQKSKPQLCFYIKNPFLDTFVLSVDYLVLAPMLPITASLLENLRFEIQISRMIFYSSRSLLILTTKLHYELLSFFGQGNN